MPEAEAKPYLMESLREAVRQLRYCTSSPENAAAYGRVLSAALDELESYRVANPAKTPPDAWSVIQAVAEFAGEHAWSDPYRYPPGAEVFTIDPAKLLYHLEVTFRVPSAQIGEWVDAGAKREQGGAV